MTNSIPSLLGFAALVSMTAACSTAQVRLATASHLAIECEGGSVHSQSDANKYYPCDSIVGDLAIEGTTLRDLSAFANVRSVSGTLTIAHNPELESLAKLKLLDSAQSVVLDDDPKLVDAHGLEGLERLERLVLRHNGFYRTTGLENLKSVGSLVVAQNQNLVSLSGLNHVKRAESVEIRENPRLCARLGLLPELARVPGELVVTHNLGVSKADVAELAGHAKATVALEMSIDG